MHSAWVEDIRLRVKCIELSLSLQHPLSPQDTCSIPRVYAVMRGGAISFSFHRRCGIYVLLIHSDIFLCVQRSEYADSFFEQDRGSGAMVDTRFGGGGIRPGAPGAEVWRFSLPTAGTDLGVAQAPSYLCEGKETASVAYASSGAAG